MDRLAVAQKQSVKTKGRLSLKLLDTRHKPGCPGSVNPTPVASHPGCAYRNPTHALTHTQCAVRRAGDVHPVPKATTAAILPNPVHHLRPVQHGTVVS
eukprot:354770-Chlamydomonas_euryale.AAC.1